MKNEIKEKLENALKDVKLYVHDLSCTKPNGKYEVDDNDYEDHFELPDDIPHLNFKRLRDCIGRGVVLAVNYGEESSCQLADIELDSSEWIYSTPDNWVTIREFDYGVIVYRAERAGGNMSMLLIPEEFYHIAQYLNLMEGGGHKPNHGLPEGVTIKDYIEYGHEVLNLKFTSDYED